MTHETDPIDETTLTRLVRDVADEWRLPPQRLDMPTWRDRVAPRARGGTARGRAWLGRLTGAGMLAIALTVGLSLVAVWMTMPRGRTGIAAATASPAATPSASATPGPSGRPTTAPAASTLPKLTVNGPLPSPTTVLLRVPGGFAIADLATGSLGPTLDGASGTSDVRQLADGTYSCICVAMDGSINGSPTHAVVELRRYDAQGALTRTVPIGEYTGHPDPRPAVNFDQPPNIDIAQTYGPDGNTAYIGWSVRDSARWKGGILVVDLATGAVTRRVGLPDVPLGPDDAPVNVMAARVGVAPDGGDALVSRATYRVERASGAYHSGTEHYLMPTHGGSAGTPVGFAAGHACPDGEADAGLTDGRLAWFLCWSNDGGSMTLRRVAGDGTALPDIQVGSSGDGGTWAVSGASIYLWMPTGRTVDRVDIATGAISSGTAPAPTATGGSGPDPIAALGRWLAPAVSAKIFLQPGIVVSPGSGSLVYAIGMELGDPGQVKSTGVFVFDERTLEPVGHWAPTADFVSLAVGADGRFVYAAGVSATDDPAHPGTASVTVYDASDGSVRLVAGQLGPNDVMFGSPYLP